jgi:hypothetical protein
MNERQISTGKRVLVACAIAFAITRMLPSLADTNSPNPQDPNGNPTAQVETSTVTASPSPTASPSIDPSSSPAPGPSITYLPNNTESPSASPSASPTSISDASITLHIPGVIKVDPRAQIAVISPVSILSSAAVLVCLSSHNAQIAVGSLPSSILANQSSGSDVALSGSAAQISTALSATQGLRLVSSGRVAGSSLGIKVVGVTAPTIDTSLCSDSGASTTVSVAALGLEEGLVKVPLTLGKKH